MRKTIMYPVLEGKIAERGIKKTAIADRLDITDRSFYNKMTGASAFTWEEVVALQSNFFPDLTKDYLMQTSAG